ncbi:MAG TPA: hypothetical protein VH590_08165 [Ktedonobacterales bacterium]|jgi:hypothetical protein
MADEARNKYMADAPNPPPAEDGAPTPDDATAPDEQPMPSPSTDEQAPPPDDASGADASAPDEAEAIEAQPKPGDSDEAAAGDVPAPPSLAPSPRWRRVGAGIGALGALLVLGGALLPTYGSGDYEGAALQHLPLLLVGLLIAPALIVLGISIWAWFNKLWLWPMTLGCLLIIAALPVHWLMEALFTSVACFDVCPPGGVHYGTGYWLPLVGFPLGAVGMIFAAIASARQRPTPDAPAA